MVEGFIPLTTDPQNRAASSANSREACHIKSADLSADPIQRVSSGLDFKLSNLQASLMLRSTKNNVSFIDFIVWYEGKSKPLLNVFFNYFSVPVEGFLKVGNDAAALLLLFI